MDSLRSRVSWRTPRALAPMVSAHSQSINFSNDSSWQANTASLRRYRATPTPYSQNVAQIVLTPRTSTAISASAASSKRFLLVCSSQTQTTDSSRSYLAAAVVARPSAAARVSSPVTSHHTPCTVASPAARGRQLRPET